MIIIEKSGVGVVTTTQVHPTKPDAHGVSEICDGEDLW